MINRFEVTETNKMIENYNLDVRTITLGISLLDCISDDLETLNNNIYNIGCWLFIEYPSSLTSLISIVSSLTSTLLSFLTAP